MSYVIQQVYKKDGKRELGSFMDSEGAWAEKIQELEKPFTTIEEVRKPVTYLHGKPDDDGEHEFETVNVQTRVRYSEKGGK